MASLALRKLTASLESKLHNADVKTISQTNMSDVILKELEWNDCRIILKDGQPVLTGNTASLDAEILDQLKEHRELIIENLKRQALHTPTEEDNKKSDVGCAPLPDRVVLCPGQERSGIHRDPITGKVHTFGHPDCDWLESLGWEWSDRHHRMMAPYPHDKADPPPRFFVGGGPAKSDNRLTGDGPCSVCGCQEWYKRADDYDPSEGWVCMVCHPAPSGVLVTPKHKGG